MPYYRGDYYRGDYYRGDLWGTLKKIGGGVVGLATGGIGGAIAGFTGASAGPRGGPPSPPGPALQAPSIPGAGQTQGGVFSGIREFFGGTPVAPNGMHRGYHLNKSNEYNPGAHRQIVVPKHTKWVKNRHMNVANPRALARAARRAHGFLRMSKKFVRYYEAKAPRGKAYIGRKRKR